MGDEPTGGMPTWLAIITFPIILFLMFMLLLTIVVDEQ